MKRLLSICVALAALGAGSSALAASDTSSVGPMPVTGNVPALCSASGVTGGNATFALGTLIDTATGFLASGLSAPDKTLAASFCNSRSTISITATPMTAQAFTGAPPANFSNSVDYTATASGWTTTPATFTTGAGANPNASQLRSTAFTGDITVHVSGFATTGGSTLRLVSDPLYQGTVTVTLAVAS